FVASGKTLIIHDRFVDAAETILPGGAGLDVRRDFSDPNNINVLAPASSVLISGPGGVITDSTLDGGRSSSHGFTLASRLPPPAPPPAAPAAPRRFRLPLGPRHRLLPVDPARLPDPVRRALPQHLRRQRRRLRRRAAQRRAGRPGRQRRPRRGHAAGRLPVRR